jgi:hypothetical protein
LKGSNLFYGVLLLFLAYFLFIPTFNIQIPYVGWNVPIPNPFYPLGQLTLPLPLLSHVPLLVYVGILGIVCIVTAFSDDKTTFVVRETPKIEKRGKEWNAQIAVQERVILRQKVLIKKLGGKEHG